MELGGHLADALRLPGEVAPGFGRVGALERRGDAAEGIAGGRGGSDAVLGEELPQRRQGNVPAVGGAGQEPLEEGQVHAVLPPAGQRFGDGPEPG